MKTTIKNSTGVPSETSVKEGYKQTDIGVIPADWDVKELRELADFVNGKAHENFISDHGNYIVVNSKFISSEGEVVKYSDEHFVPAKKDSILMVMSDVPNGRAIAKCFLVDKDNTYTINQRICALKPRIDPRFLFYKIDRNPFYLSFDDGVKQTNLRKDDVLDCRLSIPTNEEEQSAIAGAISDANALTKKLESLIEKKKNIEQGAMQELLTGKRRLPGFGGEWQMRKLRSIAKITRGQGLSKAKLSLSGKYQCILYGELFTTYSEVVKTVHSRTNYEEGALSKYGDVLIPGSTTTTGIDLAKASALLLDKVLLGGDINIVRQLDNSYNSVFLAYCLTHVNKYDIAQKTKGVTIHHLHGKDLLDLEINMPSKPEQAAIASVFTDMDTEIGALKQELDKYKQVKQGMMQVLLTGKTRLNTH